MQMTMWMYKSHYKPELNYYILITQKLQNPVALMAFIIKAASEWKQFGTKLHSVLPIECAAFFMHDMPQNAISQ